MVKRRFKAGLEEESGSEDDDSCSSQEAENPKEHNEKKKAKQDIQLEDLEKAGFVSGPSILNIKEQAPDLSFEWGRGESRPEDDQDETFEEREILRAAAGSNTLTAVHQGMEAKKKADEARNKARQEHAERQQERRESYQQKEKRKRELGQTKRATNYVEEEKRLLRQHNVYSGFD